MCYKLGVHIKIKKKKFRLLGPFDMVNATEVLQGSRSN